MTVFFFLCCKATPPPPRALPELENTDDCKRPFLSPEETKSPELFLSVPLAPAGTIVLFGEHHEQVQQLKQLTSSIEIIAAQTHRPLIFAAEWLPHSATSKLETLLRAPEWNENLWWSIIEEKYYLRPLQVKEYDIPLKSIHKFNLNHPNTPIQVVGLAPDCRIESHPTMQDVQSCLEDRERFMTDTVRDYFSPSDHSVMLISLGYRHAQQLQSHKNGSLPLGARLRSDYSVTSILLTGQEPDGLTSCGGLFDDIKEPVIVSLKEADFSTLSTECLGPDPDHNFMALSDLFTHIWLSPPAWQPPSLLPEAAFEQMKASSLLGWSKYQFEWMDKMDIGSNPQAWSAWLNSQAQNSTSQTTMKPFSCESLPRFKTPK
jgi:hypothetical protein